MTTDWLRLFGEDFPVLWSSENRRLLANRDRCVKLVSFRCRADGDQGQLDSSPVMSLEYCWLRNFHVSAFYDGDPPPEAEGLRVEPDATRAELEGLDPQAGGIKIGNTMIAMDQIARERFDGKLGKLDAVTVVPGGKVVRAMLKDGSVLFLKSATMVPVPGDALKFFEAHDHHQAQECHQKTQQELLERHQTALADRLERIEKQTLPQKDPPQPTDATMEISDTLIFHVLCRLMDEVDPRLKSAPAASQIFLRYCRDQMTLKQISRKYRWSYETLKNRKAELADFLQTNLRLTLESFFVDASVFRRAEQQLKDARAKTIYRRDLIQEDPDLDDAP